MGGNESERVPVRRVSPTKSAVLSYVVLIAPGSNEQNSQLHHFPQKPSHSFPILPPNPSSKLLHSRNLSLEPSPSPPSPLLVLLSDPELPTTPYLFPSAFLHHRSFQAIDETTWTGIRLEDRKVAMRKDGSSRGKRISESREVTIARRVVVPRTTTTTTINVKRIQ